MSEIKTVNWIITTKCNYRCSYCRYGLGNLPDDSIVYNVLKFVGDVFKTKCLNLCGGEPTLLSQLIDISRFCKEHEIFLSVDTNLSLDTKGFISVIEAGYPFFNYIHATFHMEFADFEVFCDRVRNLRATGCKIDVRLIAFHDNFENVRKMYHRLQNAGMNPRLKLEKLRRRENKSITSPTILPTYPDSYINWIAGTFGLTREEFLEKNSYKCYQGKYCYAGVKYISIDQSGQVFRCTAGITNGYPLYHIDNIEEKRRLEVLKNFQETKKCFFPICKCREAEKFELLTEV